MRANYRPPSRSASSTAWLLVAVALGLAGMQVALGATQPGSTGGEHLYGAPAAGLPTAFVPNVGQVDPRVRFLADTAAGRLFFTDSEMVWVGPAVGRDPVVEPSERARLQRDDRPLSVVHWRLIGSASPRALDAMDRLPGVVNYLKGGEAAQWRQSIPTYATIVYRQIYPGVDFELRGHGGQLASRYRIRAGADPSAIRWQVEGAGDIQVEGPTGAVRILLPASNPSGTDLRRDPLSAPQVLLRAPRAWQSVGGEEVAVPVRYRLRASGSLGFEFGAYDASQPLVVESAFDYATYLGGGRDDFANAIAVDASGNAYVAGQTWSADFPVEAGMQPSSAGGADAFIAKINPEGSAFVYTTYLGGGGDDSAEGIAVDEAGNVYLTGSTRSADFPTHQPIQAERGGGDDAFVVKLAPSGASLLYATYLGGTRDEFSDAIAVDTAGHAYAGGWTQSEDFPAVNALYPTSAGLQDAFVAKFQPAGDALTFATYLGGSYEDRIEDVAVDGSGQVYVAGWTGSNDFPTHGAVQPSYGGGGHDAFVASLDSAGAQLRYATFIGGAGDDGGCGVDVDRFGGAYVSGDTNSRDFPTTNAFQPDFGGGPYDSFIAKFNPGGSTLAYATYVGGRDTDFGYGMAVDAMGMAYVTGETQSRDFPTRNPMQPTNQGSWDVVIVKLDPLGRQPVFATYFGGSRTDFAYSIAVDPARNIYLAGWTESSDLPTDTELQPATGGGTDAFVVRIPFRNAALQTHYFPFLRRP